MKYFLVALTIALSACASNTKYCGVEETKESLGCITVDSLTLQRLKLQSSGLLSIVCLP